ncbi:unnamed protein product [Cyclocybe aegerita]|uniref:Extracellular membrane protein CFEM domain-containing protein n=1 Tax=Cyclocybe aegerita TaxID=1973307 RepID=A0A8S0WB34_CYCAE|nr:unnamed protein product [Cyclocybe aegerita]
MVALFAFALAALVSLPAALAEPTPFGLQARQSNIGFIPSQTPESCLQTTCKPLADIYAPGQCITFDCLCTDKVLDAMRTCVPCVVAANIVGWDQAVADRAIAGFIDACNNIGKTLSTSTSSASPSSSSSSSGGGSSTQTAAGGVSTAMSVNIAGLLLGVALGGIVLA